MESTPVTNNGAEEQEAITDIALIEQDKSTVKILQEDDLKTLKDAVEKVKAFKRKYTLKKLAITDITDKAQTEKLRLAIADVRTTKTGLEKDKKDKSKPYRDTVAYINSNYDAVIGKIEDDILDPLKEYKKKIDGEIEAKEKEEELKKEALTNERVDKLKAAGLTMVDGFYFIGSQEFNVAPISLGIVDIQTMTDGIFENILQQASDKAAVIAAETEKANAEKKPKEDERIAKELEDKRIFDLQQAQLKKEQDDLAAELAEFKKQKEELRLAQEKLAQEKLDEENRLKQVELGKKEARKKERILQLTSPGLHWDGAYYSLDYKHLKVAVSLNQIEDATDEEFTAIMDKVYSGITEQAVLVKEDKDAADKKAAEDKIISDKAIADKAIADKKLQEEKEEQDKKDALTKLGDKAVWNDFVSILNAITYPQCTSQEYIDKVDKVKAFHQALK